MTGAPQTIRIRRLGPGDEAVVERLAEQDPPRTELLRDPRTVFVAAFDGDDPVGFAFGYELLRRHGNPTEFFVYELGVDDAYRRLGIATRLIEELLRDQDDAFVLTDADNDAANATYRKLFANRFEVVMWDHSAH